MSGPRAIRVFLTSRHGDVEELIRSEGHQVHAAYDGDGAVAAARALSPDVAIVDMEECDNPFILAQRIRDVSPRHKPLFIGPEQVELLAGLLRRLGTMLDDYLSFDSSI